MDMKEVMKGCKNKLERIAFLKDNCNKVIEKSYSKNFTPAELQQYKEKLVEVCDKIDALEDKKKSTIKEFKLEIDPFAEQAQGNDWQHPKQGETCDRRLLHVHRCRHPNNVILQ